MLEAYTYFELEGDSVVVGEEPVFFPLVKLVRHPLVTAER